MEAAGSLLALGSNPTNVMGGGASSEPALDIVNFDPAKPAADMDIMASIPTGGRRFSSLAWGALTADGALPYGLIAGGFADGVVSLWNAQAASSGRPDSAVFSNQVHNGSVNCLDFNPNNPAIMASCGADSEVKIISLANPAKPEIFAPSPNPSTHAGSEVLALAWNRKVQHILCSCSNTGSTVVWDLKQKKEVISFKDPSSRNRCSAVAWHPDVATQLIVAYDDDRHPSLQMWDLRNVQYPFKEASGHTKGILDISWNAADPNLLLSCGKDNSILCWCLQSGNFETFSEMSTQQGNTQARWAPHRSGIFAASSMGGSVDLRSVQTQQSSSVKYCPKWYGKPGGVSFGFGAKMLSYGTKASIDPAAAPTSWCHSMVVPNEPEIVPTADSFERCIADRKLKEFCHDKMQRSGGAAQHEGLMWELMGAQFEGDSRHRVPALLGFDNEHIEQEASKYLGNKPGSTLTGPKPDETSSPQAAHNSPAAPNVNFGAALDLSQAENFFEELSATTEQKKKDEEDAAKQQAALEAMGAQNAAASASGQTDWSKGPEAIIKKNLLVGNIAAAVECCFKSNRMAEGLLLASGGGTELWTRARDEYLRLLDDPFLSTVGSIMTNDFDKLVASSNLNNWRETLAIIATYSQGPQQDPQQAQFKTLCMQLAERLEKEKFDIRSAVICYVCAGNFQKTVGIWSNTMNKAGSKNFALQDLVEKMAVFQQATKFDQADPQFNAKLTQYAEILANSGRLTAAMHHLCLLRDDASSAILRERIYNAAPVQMSQLFGRPPAFPFEPMDVRIAYAAPAPVQQQHPGVAKAGMPGAPGHGMQGRPGMPGPAASAPNPGMQPRPGMPAAGMPPAPNVGGYAGGQSPYPGQHGHGQHGQHAPSPGPQAAPAPSPGPGLPPRPQIGASAPAPGFGGGHHGHAAATPNYAPQPVHHQPSYQPTAAPTAGAGVLPPGGMGGQCGGMGHHGGGMGGGMTPGGAAMGGQQQMGGPPRQSTAPQASAMPVTDGMPTPWPLPTKTQQKLSTTTSVAAANMAVQDNSVGGGATTVGEAMQQHELSHIQGTFSMLLDVASQDGNQKKREDIAKRLDELYAKLAGGNIKTVTGQKVLSLVKALEAQDTAASSKLQQELYTTDWEMNKSWLMGLKRLLAGR